MKRQLLKYIHCPVCRGTFDLKISKENAIEIENGLLTCSKCRFIAEISDGVVNLLHNLDSDTLKEISLHLQDAKERFEEECKKSSRNTIERQWAYMEQDSSKEYGRKIKSIFWNVMRQVEIKKTDVVLDIGIGTGWSTCQLAKRSNNCIGIDLCKPIKLDLSKVFFKKEKIFFERCMANVLNLPLHDQCVDKVVCMASLHHASDLSVALKEIARVLKVEGELILIGEPVIPEDYIGKDDGFLKEKLKGFNEHQYTATDWFLAAEKAGLYATDGTRNSDDLNKYYLVDKHEFQNPLPVFVKKINQNDNKLKIALVSQEYSRDCNGGICRYTYDLAHGLADLGHEVHVITKSEIHKNFDITDGNIFVHKIVPQDTGFIGLPNSMSISDKNLSYSYAVCIKLLQLIKNNNIQIVEAPLWDAEGFVFSLLNSGPLVIRIETPLFKVAEINNWEITKDLKFSNWMEGETVRRADKIIAISAAIGTLVGNHHSVPKDKIVFSPLGIELPDKSQTIQDTKNNKNFNILFVGRLEKRKGIETLFRAIPKIIDKIPHAIFTIVGSDTDSSPSGGSYKKYLLENLNQEYHSIVFFEGFVSNKNLKNYYKNCDVFVAPSLYESFGLIYLEAMAWGKPVIGCNLGGIPEVIEEDVTGFLIRQDDEDDLAKKIILLLDNTLRYKIGQCARESVKTKFSIEKMVNNTLSVYNSIIGLR